MRLQFSGIVSAIPKAPLCCEGAEFYSLHEIFHESYEEVQDHIHGTGERLNGLGGVPAASFTKLAELCCFTPESDGAY